VFDDPENQFQGETSIDLTSDNLMIIGSAQFGKTNLLQSLIRSITSCYSPEEVNLYILDFGSMVLKTFESLLHVGGVVTSSEDEKLKNFFKLIFNEMARRKEHLASVGVSSFASYKEAGYIDIPQIVIVIDNLTALKELYLNDDDSLLSICRDGLAVGVSVIVANAQTSGIGYKYLSNFASRIALFCNDSNEYSSLFDQCRLRPKEVPGRCIIKRDKKLYECQTYLAFTGEKEIERVRDMKAYIEARNLVCPNQKAKNIPEIPNVLTDIYAEQQFSHFMKKPYNLGVGLDFNTVTPIVFDLSRLGVLAITGREKSGKGNFVKNIVYSLERRKLTEHVEISIIDDAAKKFAALKTIDIVTKYTIDTGTIDEILTTWSEELARRYALLTGESDFSFEEVPLLLLIIQNQDVLQEISIKKELMDKYKAITTKYKAMKACIIISSLANEAIPYSGPEPVKMIKEARNMVVFDDISNVKVLDIPFATIKEFKKPIDLGDAYYIKGNETLKIKTILHTEKNS
jgi:S-DNA-T family DNA segregation ATPase FtsK/SpoIIIE